MKGELKNRTVTSWNDIVLTVKNIKELKCKRIRNYIFFKRTSILEKEINTIFRNKKMHFWKSVKSQIKYTEGIF